MINNVVYGEFVSAEERHNGSTRSANETYVYNPAQRVDCKDLYN